jgi:hypothetical protein
MNLGSSRSAAGPTIDGYGQTETVLAIGNPPGRAIKPGSMGIPSPAFEVAVPDESLQRAPPGVEGEWPSGPSRGRRRCLPATEGTSAAAVFGAAGTLTGDRASVDADGAGSWGADDVIQSPAIASRPGGGVRAPRARGVVESARWPARRAARADRESFVVLRTDAAGRVQASATACATR